MSASDSAATAASLDRSEPASARSAPPRLAAGSIIEAAGRLIDEDGPEALTMTRIAAELGVTQPALYRHVGAIGDVWRLLGLSTREMLVDRLTQATVGLSCDHAVWALASAWRSFSLDHPGRYRSTDRFAVAGDADLEAAARRTIDVIGRTLAGYDLEDRARYFAATTLRSALHGFVSFELTDGHPDRDESDDAFAALVDHLIRSIRDPQP